jgi:hypothetical protein
MTEGEATELLRRFESRQCTQEERELVESWYMHAVDSQSLPADQPDYQAVKIKLWRRLVPRRIVYISLARYAAAAIIIGGLAYGYHFVNVRNVHQSAQIINAIQPGGNKAVLVLANGQSISLNDSHSGKVAVLPGVQISNDTSSGIVTYKLLDNKVNNTIQLNTIKTPSGGQYQLILPDGSKVFLNAASTLTFPSGFAANKREVTLTGEAYFEITKNPGQPFFVMTVGQQLKVIGTHFNISAYPSEPLRTTLAEGSVELSQLSQKNISPQKQLLKPDQQATLLSDGFQVKHVDASDEVAWKDGLFVFKQTQLLNVLQQISRWYNIKVDYSNIPNKTVDAEISRTLTLSRFLQILEAGTGINITLDNEGRLFVEK